MERSSNGERSASEGTRADGAGERYYGQHRSWSIPFSRRTGGRWEKGQG